MWKHFWIMLFLLSIWSIHFSLSGPNSLSRHGCVKAVDIYWARSSKIKLTRRIGTQILTFDFFIVPSELVNWAYGELPGLFVFDERHGRIDKNFWKCYSCGFYFRIVEFYLYDSYLLPRRANSLSELERDSFVFEMLLIFFAFYFLFEKDYRN